VTTDTKSIGPAGGTLTIDGAELVIPPNALATTIDLTLTKTANAAPSFVTTPSAVFELAPAGTVFSGLVTFRITHATAPAATTKIFWNKLGVANPTAAADFETLLETTITGNVVEAKNNHFSDPLDGECLADVCPELRCCTPETCGGCL